jgi:hypothetical protein
MYKIACFRDDVVFVVWIFQCWLYPVDPSRANEFGFIAREAEGDESDEDGPDEGPKKLAVDTVIDGKVKTD